MRRALAACLLATSCGAGESAPVPNLTISFPAAVDGVVPYATNGTFEVELRGTLSGLAEPTRARVDIVTDQNPPGATTTGTVSLMPLADGTLGARAELVWPPGGDVDVRATALGTTTNATVSIGGAVTLAIAANPPALPPPGNLVQVTVVAKIAATPAAGVPISFETAPVTQVLPSSVITGADGTVAVNVLVPAGAVALRVDAVNGAVRTGITLVP